MTASSRPDDTYFLNYRWSDYFFIGGLLVAVSIVTAAGAFFQEDRLIRGILVSVAGMSGVVAFYCLRIGIRFRSQGAWYLRFQPSRISLNFFDYRKNDLRIPQGSAIFSIPRDELIWIRKAAKRSSADDADKFYVDLRVPSRTWTAAQEFRSDFQAAYDPLERDRGAGGVQFFDVDIIRISLDGSQWPQDLAAHWRLCGYPVIEDYEIGYTTKINPDADGSKDAF